MSSLGQLSIGTRTTNVTVLGGGHGALAAAADFALRGFDVRLALRNRERFDELFATRTITARGSISGVAELTCVSTDHAALVEGADLIVVALPAHVQTSLIETIAESLRPGQVVLLAAGIFSCWPAAKALEKRGVEGVVLAETPMLPYGARVSGPASVTVAVTAPHVPIGVYPANQTDMALQRVLPVFSGAFAVEDALSAALLNSSGATHAPLVMMNAGPIERLEAYDIHVEGSAPSVLRVVSALDDERTAVRAAAGYAPPHWPVIDFYQGREWLWGERGFAGVTDSSAWRERISFDHRYLHEDVGCGLTLWNSLARQFDVPTPLTEAFLQLASVLARRNYTKDGRTLENLGLADVQIGTLKQWLQFGFPSDAGDGQLPPVTESRDMN